uniref:Uncharacterized protein n=1 Tax=Anguilla anguilla TaxID=7936 RepID=A0A0E9VW99_ANGAN
MLHVLPPEFMYTCRKLAWPYSFRLQHGLLACLS